MARINPQAPRRGSAQSLLQTIDNYYQPARDRVGEAALQRGLSQLGGVFQGIADRQKAEELEDIAKQGQADANAGVDPSAEFKAVREGALFGSRSKVYQEAYHEAMGRKAAIEYSNDLKLEYRKKNLHTNTDQEAFRGWMHEKMSSFIEDNKENSHFVNGAMPYMEQFSFNMAAQHTSNISKEMERQRVAAMAAEADNWAMQFATDEINEEELLAGLAGVDKAYYATGSSGAKVKVHMLGSLLQVADATDNLELLEVVDNAVKSGKIKLTAKQWNAVQDQMKGVQSDINFREAQKSKAITAQIKSEESVVSEAISKVYSNPANAHLPLKEAIAMDPELAEMMVASPYTAELYKKADEVYKVVNGVSSEIGTYAELSILSDINERMENGELRDKGDIVSYLRGLDAVGVQYNDTVVKEAFKAVETYNDPEGPYGSTAFKENRKLAQTRLINHFAPDAEFDIYGQSNDAQVTRVKGLFNKFLTEELEAIPSRTPAAYRQAIEAAEKAVHDIIRQEQPEFYTGRALASTSNSNVDGLNINDPHLLRHLEDLQRLKDDQEAADADAEAAFDNLPDTEDEALVVVEDEPEAKLPKTVPVEGMSIADTDAVENMLSIASDSDISEEQFERFVFELYTAAEKGELLDFTNWLNNNKE